MMADIILHSPEKHERRHKQDCAPVGTEYSAHFAEARHIIIEMLYDIKSSHQIERSIFKGQTFCGALLYFSQAARAAEVQGFGGHINSLGVAELGEHL